MRATPHDPDASRAHARCRTRLRRVVGCFGALLALWLAAACHAASPQAGRIVRVGVFENPPLISYSASERRIVGMYGAILEATAQREGWSLQYVPGSFAQGLEAVRKGEIDLLPNVPHTSAREQFFTFNRDPVLSAWGQVYVRPGSRIARLEDLAGKRVAVLESGVLPEFLRDADRQLPAPTTLDVCSEYQDAFRRVAAGRADAVLSNPYSGPELSSRFHLVPTQIVLPPYTYRFAAPRHERAANIEAIDRTLLNLKAEPGSIYYTALQQLTQRAPAYAVPPWLKWAAAAAVLLVALGAAWALTLRRASQHVAWSERNQQNLATALARIFDLSMDVIVIIDHDYTIVRVSRAAERLWGCSPDDLVGRSGLDLIAAEDRASATGHFTAVRAGKPVQCASWRLLRPDGSAIPMRWCLGWSGQQQEIYAVGRPDCALNDGGPCADRTPG